MLIGKKGIDFLHKSKVIVFGVGGVGSYAVEALARAGIGELVLVDFDIIDVTNINRQLPALFSTIGKYKVDVLKQRIKDINPLAQVNVYKTIVTPENVEAFFKESSTYVVDAIDSIKGKIAIIETALAREVPVISSMGVGNRLDPTKLKIGALRETSGCPLARIMRRELKKRGLAHNLKVVYSTELPMKTEGNSRSRSPGTISFVPSVAGLLLAAYVVNDLLRFL
ncbi:MAG: tRNA threonylcarbamoyladenosine dehydratase [Peptococcia bacterium]|jgi:tRNA A37 threonylcarbamoyladenosine dehydratase